jgi:signal transduction histidine kinase
MQYSEIVQQVLELTQKASEASDKAKRQRIETDLRAFLEPLRAAETYMLITIMYPGRDGGGIAGLMDNYQSMSDTFRTPGSAISQMLEKTSLHDYLRRGLNKLQDAGIELNTLLSTYIDSPLALLNNSEGVELCLGPWRCDNCGELISQPDQGTLLWLSRVNNGRLVGRDLQIVHKMTTSPLGAPNRCYPNDKHELDTDGSIISDMFMDRSQGPDGLVRLLSMIEDGLIPVNQVTRIIMRLFVPGYEQAKPYFQRAIDTGVVQRSLPDDYFLQSQLRDIVANIPRLDE